MTRPTARGGSPFGPMTFVAFFIGIGIGLVLVTPVLPQTFETALGLIVRAGGTVIITGVLALAVLMVMLAIMYQGYLKA